VCCYLHINLPGYILIVIVSCVCKLFFLCISFYHHWDLCCRFCCECDCSAAGNTETGMQQRHLWSVDQSIGFRVLVLGTLSYEHKSCSQPPIAPTHPCSEQTQQVLVAQNSGIPLSLQKVAINCHSLPQCTSGSARCYCSATTQLVGSSGGAGARVR